ncbi:DUF2314 domain-containing protein [Chitinimonas arctica]|uniref:DUF2314 domain-containing protein n=1 Tax=Chitinimonas arctica TaxID=2594795 RepID=A0A516SBI3_9NEIS|nr:DUF2314 domain-containing protein [Chitinimonas arctica]QDQ25504.1 DUF2314 domain-containing protein [Chitinimonas arctica]
MTKFVLAILLGIASLGAAADKIDDQIVNVSAEDRDMNLAIGRARRTLDKFLALYREPPEGAINFKLKVMLSDDNGVEHFWFIPFKEIKGGFAGVLANDPSIVNSVTAGQVYAFKREQITDWGYELNGKQIGSFTVCVLFKTMPKEEVARYKQDHGFVCEN